MQNVVGPTLVAMAMKFGLGAEIQSPIGYCICTLPFDALFTQRWRTQRATTTVICRDHISYQALKQVERAVNIDRN